MTLTQPDPQSAGVSPSTHGAPVLEIQDLSVSLPPGLDRANAVEAISLTIHPREILCIVGESGSGKSVTASVVMGLLPKGSLTVERGAVTLNGESITTATESRMNTLRGDRMAMIFQEPLTALNPVMALGPQIAEVLDLHKPNLGAQAKRERALKLMRDVQLPDPEALYSRFPHQISGGQRQRVMIAMALALEPALIIADEPTTALDVTTQAQILRLFRSLLTEHDSAVLLITHDFGVVAEVADRVIVMRRGQIVESGTTAEILESPRHDYTRELIAAVPRMSYRPQVGAAQPLLAVEGMSITYRQRSLTGRTTEVFAVRDVSLALAKGETLAIVGESGSGKSTLARGVVGFERPDKGRVVIDGTDMLTVDAARARALRRRIQMIFQDPYSSLNPRRRIGQSMAEGPLIDHRDRAEVHRRSAELMDLVGLAPSALDRYPHEFSGGQRQRICIARALAMRPDVIVADEAVSALDVTVQAQVLELFADLQREIGFSMLFITHDLRVASNISNRVAVMQAGRIVETGAIAAVFTNPSHEYTRNLLAAIPGGSAL